ncbi:snare-like protein [Hypoxylon sp. NC1633]|nr:snare-like protein [Hypoxylon sp. NC1633]
MPIQVYSFYIFDRHTECIYSKLWLSRPGPPSNLTTPTPSRPQSQQPLSVPAAVPDNSAPAPTAAAAAAAPSAAVARRKTGVGGGGGRVLSAADDAKLIFGTVFSLRNMVRKLGGDDDAFIAYRTAHYKLHYYETPTNLRFAMLTEPGALSMRNVLHQIYINLWVEYVVKNPLSPVEHKGGDGVRNEMFEMGLDKFVRGLM